MHMFFKYVNSAPIKSFVRHYTGQFPPGRVFRHPVIELLTTIPARPVHKPLSPLAFAFDIVR